MDVIGEYAVRRDGAVRVGAGGREAVAVVV
jgi:hypothetical protein